MRGLSGSCIVAAILLSMVIPQGVADGASSGLGPVSYGAGASVRVDVDAALWGRPGPVLDLLVPESRRAAAGFDQRIERDVAVAVSLPSVGRVEFELEETFGSGGQIPVFDMNSVPQEQLEYAFWSGRSDAGDAVSLGFIHKNGAWSTLGVRVSMASMPDRTWVSEPGGHGLEVRIADPLAVYAESDNVGPAATISSSPVAGTTTPIQSLSSPAYPVGGQPVEARSADLLAFGAFGLTAEQTLITALYGVSDFNTTMNRSSSGSWPIADVSVRVVGVGTVGDVQGEYMAADLNDVETGVDNIRSALGADLAVVVYPSRWAHNSPSDLGSACGGWPYGENVGVIVIPTATDCDQTTKFALAHELGHAYSLTHEDLAPEPDPDPPYRRAYVSGSYRTLVASGADGRSLQIGNPEKNFLGTGIPSGTASYNNAKWIHEVANSIAQRSTFVGSVAGAPGKYVRLVTPARVFDTRATYSVGGFTTPMTPVTSSNFSEVRGVSLLTVGVPAAANAVMLNVTTVNATGSGWVGVNSTKDVWPNTMASISNFKIGAAKATGVIVTPGDYGVLWVRVGGASSDVVIDVMGYFLSLIHI